MIQKNKYDIVYDEVYNIMTNCTEDNNLIKLAEYCETFRNEEDRGMLRTILMTCKTFRDTDELKDIYTVLADKLRSGSTSGKI